MDLILALEISRNYTFLIIAFPCNAKCFAIAILFFIFLIPGAVFLTKIGCLSLDTLANYCVYALKFCVCEHDMSCTLEINSNGGSKRGHIESCLSITTNIISPLSQCLWLPNLAGWWLTMRVSYPLKSHDPLITWSCEIT